MCWSTSPTRGRRPPLSASRRAGRCWWRRTGLTRMFHNDAEAAVAKAAAAEGLPYALSTMGTTRIEDFARLGDFPKAFQIYIFKDRGLTAEFVERCKASAIDARFVTVDTPVAGNRRRDRRQRPQPAATSQPPRACSFRRPSGLVAAGARRRRVRDRRCQPSPRRPRQQHKLAVRLHRPAIRPRVGLGRRGAAGGAVGRAAARQGSDNSGRRPPRARLRREQA